MLSILPYLRLPPFSQLCFCLCLLCRLPDLQLYPFSGPQYFTLQVEAAPFGWIISVKEVLESLHHSLHIRLASLRWPDVKNLAGFIQCKTRGGEVVGRARATTSRALFGILL